jgi:hypothetical protein
MRSVAHEFSNSAPEHSDTTCEISDATWRRRPRQ